MLTNWSLTDLVLVNDLLELLRPVHFVMLLENPWLEILILNKSQAGYKTYMLIHDSGLPEVSLEFLKTLNPAIGDLATFLGVEHCPFASVKLAMEV